MVTARATIITGARAILTSLVPTCPCSFVGLSQSMYVEETVVVNFFTVVFGGSMNLLSSLCSSTPTTSSLSQSLSALRQDPAWPCHWRPGVRIAGHLSHYCGYCQRFPLGAGQLLFADGWQISALSALRPHRYRQKDHFWPEFQDFVVDRSFLADQFLPPTTIIWFLQGQTCNYPVNPGPWREWIDLEHSTVYNESNSWNALTGEISCVWATRN